MEELELDETDSEDDDSNIVIGGFAGGALE